MNNNIKIAVINPTEADGIARTVIDGLLQLFYSDEIEFSLCSKFNYYDLDTEKFVLTTEAFNGYAQKADAIFLLSSKRGTNYQLAEKINLWGKTVFFDGFEAGRNRRYDFESQYKILQGGKDEPGCVNQTMLKKCQAYFRREKPYINNILPLPFGIETKYSRGFDAEKKKDIDFFCVFGQDEYPLMRRYATKILEDYCQKNNFVCHTKKTNNQDEFYELLSKSKVGISIGGGGYDTLRFWETLANNCLLLTESIDIYYPDAKRLDYKRIWQFANLFDFKYQLEKIGDFLLKEYDQKNLTEEYEKIMREHSSLSRVKEILNFLSLP